MGFINRAYRWRDEFLNNAHRAFEANGVTGREQKLLKEIQRA